MRIIIHNPHYLIWYGVPLFSFILRKHSVRKYAFFLRYLIKENIDFAVCLDGTKTSLPRKLAKLMPLKMEFFLWALVNNINPFKLTIIRKLDELSSNDVFFSHVYDNFTLHGNPNVECAGLVSQLKKTKAMKIFHLTHYMYDIDKLTRHCENAAIDYFVCENNLKKNSPFFNKYFEWYNKDVYVLPNAWQERFKNNIQFYKRKNKAVATGSITYEMSDLAFSSFFKTNKVQPMRNAIYDNQAMLTDQIDCLISDIREGKKAKQKYTEDSFIVKLFKIIYNTVSIGQSKYYNFDIVQKYNEYKMFIVPEEVNNLPGISSIEGMACGCAYIGIRDPMYSDIGLEDGIHYIGYDGTLDDLMIKIEYYQGHQDELERIALQGYEYVRDKFSGSAVAKTFLNDLYNLLVERNKLTADKSEIIFRSSFIQTGCE